MCCTQTLAGSTGEASLWRGHLRSMFVSLACHNTLVFLNGSNILSPVLEARSPKSSCWQGPLPLKVRGKAAPGCSPGSW